MLTARVSLRDGPANTVFEILIQGSYESLLHACVGFTNLLVGKGIGASTHGNDEPVLGELADAPVIAHHIEHPEEVLPYLGYTFQLPLLSYIHADAAAEFRTYFLDEIEPRITESLNHGLVKTAKAFHVAGYGPVLLLLIGQSLKLQLLWQSHVMSPIQK